MLWAKCEGTRATLSDTAKSLDISRKQTEWSSRRSETHSRRLEYHSHSGEIGTCFDHLLYTQHHAGAGGRLSTSLPPKNCHWNQEDKAVIRHWRPGC